MRKISKEIKASLQNLFLHKEIVFFKMMALILTIILIVILGYLVCVVKVFE